MVVVFWLIISLKVVSGVLQCYQGDSLLSLSRSVTFPELQRVKCGSRGFCQVTTERRSDMFYVSKARCVERCTGPSLRTVEQICCQTDFCNLLSKSQTLLPSLAIDSSSPLLVSRSSSSTPSPSFAPNRVGMSGINKEKDICVTVVLLDPPMPGGLLVEEGGKVRQTTLYAKGAYVVLKRGAANCTWNRETEGNADLLLASGWWSNLAQFQREPRPYFKMNITVTSEVFTGQVRFDATRFVAAASPPVTDKQPLSYLSDISLLRRAARSAQDRFIVTTTGKGSSKSNGTAKATVADQTLTVQISSPSGIGSATITKSKGVWPRRKVILLNLRGLEHFQVSNSDTTLHASVSSDSIRLWANDAESDLLPQLSQMSITVVNETLGDIRPPYRFPLAPGLQFQIVLPSVLFTPKLTTLQLQWIDFYR